MTDHSPCHNFALLLILPLIPLALFDCAYDRDQPLSYTLLRQHDCKDHYFRATCRNSGCLSRAMNHGERMTFFEIIVLEYCLVSNIFGLRV